MRLYLTSYRLGDRPEDLVALAGERRHVAVVANASDAFPEEGRPAYVQREIDDLQRLGFSAEELDLREWFGRQDELAEHVRKFGVVWAKGGNSFVLRRAFRQSGFDDVLTEALRRDALVYAGYSAGAVLAPPTLRGIDVMDEPEAQPPGYQPSIVWEGLGLVPFLIVPHFESDHFESELAGRCVRHLIEHHVPFIALRDGETVVMDDAGWRVTPADARRSTDAD